MQFQKSTDVVYAMRILHYLHTYKDTFLTAQVISKAVCITEIQFAKIADQLKEKGLIASTNGEENEYRLAKAAHKISVYDVLLIVEGALDLNRSLNEGGDCGLVCCGAQDYWASIQDALVDVLSKKDIASIDMVWQM